MPDLNLGRSAHCVGGILNAYKYPFQDYPPEDIVKGPYRYKTYDSGLLKQMLDGFTPDRARLYLPIWPIVASSNRPLDLFLKDSCRVAILC
jgi:hypothetical protein